MEAEITFIVKATLNLDSATFDQSQTNEERLVSWLKGANDESLLAISSVEYDSLDVYGRLK